MNIDLYRSLALTTSVGGLPNGKALDAHQHNRLSLPPRKPLQKPLKAHSGDDWSLAARVGEVMVLKGRLRSPVPTTKMIDPPVAGDRGKPG